jgi:hypothetical protein
MFNIPLILQSPLAMIGLLTLLIPLGIHLLSKARPRVITFAHIAFIKVKTSPLLRQLRLTQLILLGIRMLLLLLATLILAQLHWQNPKQPLNSHILLTEDWLSHATDAEKQTLIDHVNESDLVLLSTKNRSIHKTELAQWSTDNLQTPSVNIWSKVADYSAQLPANALITVYTTNRIKQFIGGKVSPRQRVQWQVKTVSPDNFAQQYSTNIKVIYDDSSESLLVYLRAAFDAINTHKKLNLIVNYSSNEKLVEDSGHLLEYDKIINLSKAGFAQQHLAFDAQWQHTHIPQAELKNIKQADFVFTLARLLYSSQSHTWWLENTRLTIEQITQSSTLSANPKTLLTDKKFSQKITPSASLHTYLVLILVALFILERLLSEWPKRELKPGQGE